MILSLANIAYKEIAAGLAGIKRSFPKVALVPGVFPTMLTLIQRRELHRSTHRNHRQMTGSEEKVYLKV